MTNLDEKIRDIFPEESMYKTPDRYSLFSGVNVPSFIKDWLIKKFSNDDIIDTEGMFNCTIRNRRWSGEWNEIRHRECCWHLFYG